MRNVKNLSRKICSEPSDTILAITTHTIPIATRTKTIIIKVVITVDKPLFFIIRLIKIDL